MDRKEGRPGDTDRLDFNSNSSHTLASVVEERFWFVEARARGNKGEEESKQK